VPDGMPGALAKGVICQAVDKLLNQASQRPTLEKLLEREHTVEDFLAQVAFPGPLAKHIVKHVMGDEPPGFWPFHGHKDAILLNGLLEALRLAGRNLPIDSCWLCAGNMFQVGLTRSNQQVNLLFMTPPPPANWAPLATPEEDDVWQVVNAHGAAMIEKAGAFPIGDEEGRPVSPRPPDQRPVLVREVPGDQGQRIAAVFRSKCGR